MLHKHTCQKKLNLKIYLQENDFVSTKIMLTMVMPWNNCAKIVSAQKKTGVYSRSWKCTPVLRPLEIQHTKSRSHLLQRQQICDIDFLAWTTNNKNNKKCTFEFPFFVILEEKDIFVFFIFSFLNPRFAQLTTSLEKKQCNSADKKNKQWLCLKKNYATLSYRVSTVHENKRLFGCLFMNKK